MIIRSVLLFALAALAEIGGAWLIWQGVREHKGLWWIGAGIAALGAYGFVATLQADANFGRILAFVDGLKPVEPGIASTATWRPNPQALMPVREDTAPAGARWRKP